MKYVVWGVIAAIVLVVCILVLFNEELIFWRTFSYMAEKIAGEGGIHPRLAEVFAVVFALGFALSATITLNPARRRRGLIAVASMTALYSGFMYAMTRDFNYRGGKPIAFLQEQPDGTFIRTANRHNPSTNAPNIPITPENERWADGRSAQRVQASASTVFFGLSGRALVFYARRGSEVELFDRPGAHPQTRERLMPVTPDVVSEALAVQAAPLGGSGAVMEVRYPKRVTILPDMELFDGSGTPLFWFDPAYEKWELYDAPGAHPRSGTSMVPLDRSYAALLRHSIAEEMKRQPADLRGRGLQELRNYSKALTARTGAGS